MKEDILEQAVDDWFLSQPSTFTKHNVKFKPDKNHPDFLSKSDSNFSDIDVLAVHLGESGHKKVSAVSCKSWQGGFNPKITCNILLNKPEAVWSGRAVWKAFRELVSPKWGKAFSEKIFEETGSRDFTYYLLATKIVVNKGVDIQTARNEFENCSEFVNNLKYDSSSEVKIKLMTFKELFYQHFNVRKSTTLEATELGRLLQIFRASDIKLELNEK